MDKSLFGADESCLPHNEDLLSSTVLVGNEDHKRDEIRLSPIFGDTSPSGKPGLRYRNTHATKVDDDSGDSEGSKRLGSTNHLGLSLDSTSESRSDEQVDSSQTDAECGDAAFIDERESTSSTSPTGHHRTHESAQSDTPLQNESRRVVNPFERSVCVSSLSQSIFSPGILAELSNLPKNTPKTATNGEFKWSIEHLAVLNPVEISEEDIIRSRISPSSFHDPSKQAAIEQFFRSNAAYHPSPDVFRKPPTPLAAPSAKRLRGSEMAFQLPSSSFLQPSPLTRPAVARIPRVSQFQRVRTFSTQTTLTIPPSEDIDLLAILGAQYSYDEQSDREAKIEEDIEEEEEERDLSASNLSLRRRLFLNDDEEEEEEMERSALIHEREDILTPLSSDHSSSILSGNRSSSSLLEDLGSGARGINHLNSPSPSRPTRKPLLFPDCSPIAPNL